MSRRDVWRGLAAAAVVGVLVVGASGCGGRADPAVGAPTSSATRMPQDDLETLGTAVGVAGAATAVESDLAGDDG